MILRETQNQNDADDANDAESGIWYRDILKTASQASSASLSSHKNSAGVWGTPQKCVCGYPNAMLARADSHSKPTPTVPKKKSVRLRRISLSPVLQHQHPDIGSAAKTSKCGAAAQVVVFGFVQSDINLECSGHRLVIRSHVDLLDILLFGIVI